MCPLRVILIFLSATIAGFFLLRNLNAEPDLFQDDDAAAAGDDGEESPRDAAPLHYKVLLSPCSYLLCFSNLSPHYHNPCSIIFFFWLVLSPKIF
jgi:hypothetical protein